MLLTLDDVLAAIQRTKQANTIFSATNTYIQAVASAPVT
jgi:hypothetical protein